MSGDERAKLDGAAGRVGRQEAGVGKFVDAYRRYCWPVNALADLKLAPFHLLASEGKVHTDKSHVWHIDTIAAVCRADPEVLLATAYKVIDVTDPAGVAAGVEWWTALTGRGGEGMVVKPLDFLLRGRVLSGLGRSWGWLDDYGPGTGLTGRDPREVFGPRFAAALVAAQRLAGVRNAVLAAAAGVSEWYVSRLRGGKVAKPSLPVVAALLAALGKRWAWLDEI